MAAEEFAPGVVNPAAVCGELEPSMGGRRRAIEESSAFGIEIFGIAKSAARCAASKYLRSSVAS